MQDILGSPQLQKYKKRKLHKLQQSIPKTSINRKVHYMENPRAYDGSDSYFSLSPTQLRQRKQQDQRKTQNLLPELTINTSMINLVDQIESPVVRTHTSNYKEVKIPEKLLKSH